MIRQLAHHPDLTNANENQQRRDVIEQMRGFARGVLLFTGLANNIAWRRFHVTTAEVADMLYANHPTWRALAPLTLTVGEGASHVGRVAAPGNPNMHILSMARDICHANPVPACPEIVCLNRPDGRISVMEGHSRATAFVLEAHRLPNGVDVYVGSSPSVATWRYL